MPTHQPIQPPSQVPSLAVASTSTPTTSLGVFANGQCVSTTPVPPCPMWPSQQFQLLGLQTGSSPHGGSYPTNFMPYMMPPWFYPWAGQSNFPMPCGSPEVLPTSSVALVMANVPIQAKPVETSSSASIPISTAHASTVSMPLPTVVVPPVVVAASDSPTEHSRFNQMEAAIAVLQASVAKKDSPVSDTNKRLRPLADEVYDEVLPTKYKRPNFTKFDGSGNPWDHITTFEIECGSIATNDKLKLQQFPSSLTGFAMRWFNNRPSGSIASWETLVELFTAHFQSMEVPVKIEHLKLCMKETKESFREYVQRY